MTEMYDPKGIIDPQLKRKIEALRMTPKRDAEAVERGRQKFLAELNSIQEFESRSTFPWLAGWFTHRKNHKGDASMNPRTPKFAFATVAVLITILFLLFGGAGGAALAAQSALPGDTLYPVKTGLEDTRVLLAGDAYNQAQLHLSFAKQRLDDMSSLVLKGRYGDVELASKEFEAYVEKATSDLQTVMAGNPERGALLSNQITSAMLSNISLLKGVQASVPVAIQPAVQQAILASQTSVGEQIDNGDVNQLDNKDANQLDNGDANQLDNGDANQLDSITETPTPTSSITAMPASSIAATPTSPIAATPTSPITATPTDANQIDNGNANQIDNGNANQSDNGNANQGDNGNANQGDNGGGTPVVNPGGNNQH